MFAKTSNLKKMFNGGGGGGVCGPLPVPEMIGSQRRRSVHFDPMASTVLTVPGPEDEGMFKMSLLNALTLKLWCQYKNVSFQQKHTKRSVSNAFDSVPGAQTYQKLNNSKAKSGHFLNS